MMRFPTASPARSKSCGRPTSTKGGVLATKGRSLVVRSGRSARIGDQGVAVATGAALQRAAASPSFATIEEARGAAERQERARPPVPGAPPLVVDDVAVHFGGIAALDG